MSRCNMAQETKENENGLETIHKQLLICFMYKVKTVLVPYFTGNTIHRWTIKMSPIYMYTWRLLDTMALVVLCRPTHIGQVAYNKID